MSVKGSLTLLCNIEEVQIHLVTAEEIGELQEIRFGLIMVVDSRLVSGILEKVYQVAAHRFDLGRELLGSIEQSDEQLDEILAFVFDGPKAEVREAIRQGVLSLPQPEPVPNALFLRKLMALTPAQIARLRGQLSDLIKDIEEESG